MDNKPKFALSSAALHILAMVFMLCDHLWASIVPGNDWLTCIGRLAFPLFAFMIVEGYFHTKNVKKYALRLLVWAVIAEIPFNLFVSGRFFNPFQQNVLWCFLISLGLIHWNEKASDSGKPWLRAVVACASVCIGYLAGILTMVDYLHAGILTVLVFYFFRGRSWQNFLLQLICLGYIHLEMLGGLSYPVSLLGLSFDFPRQGFALLALLPIWLYRGEQGYHSKALQILYYAFYPAHMLILSLL